MAARAGLPGPCFVVWIGNVPSKVWVDGRPCPFPFEALYVQPCRQHFGCVGGYLAERDDQGEAFTMGWLLFRSQEHAVDAALWARATPVHFDHCNPEGVFQPQPDLVQVCRRIQSNPVRLAAALAEQAKVDRRLEFALNGQLEEASPPPPPPAMPHPEGQPPAAVATAALDRAEPWQLKDAMQQVQQVQQAQQQQQQQQQGEEEEEQQHQQPPSSPPWPPANSLPLPPPPPLVSPPSLLLEEAIPPPPSEEALPPLPTEPTLPFPPQPGAEAQLAPAQAPAGVLPAAVFGPEEGGEGVWAREGTPDLQGPPLDEDSPDVGIASQREGTPGLGWVWESAAGGIAAAAAGANGEAAAAVDAVAMGAVAPPALAPIQLGRAESSVSAGPGAQDTPDERLGGQWREGPNQVQPNKALQLVGSLQRGRLAGGANQPTLLRPVARVDDALRERARKHLLAPLQLPAPAEAEEGGDEVAQEPADVACGVEQALFDVYGEDRDEYKRRTLALENNLKKNALLRRRVLVGVVMPERLVCMTAEELADKELAEELRRLHQRSMRMSVLDANAAAKFSTAAALEAKQQAQQAPALAAACGHELLARAPSPSPISPSSSRGFSPGGEDQKGGGAVAGQQQQEGRGQGRGRGQGQRWPFAKRLTLRATTLDDGAISTLQPSTLESSPHGSTIGGRPALGMPKGTAAPVAAAEEPDGPSGSVAGGAYQQEKSLEEVLAEFEGLQSAIKQLASMPDVASTPDVHSLPYSLPQSPRNEPGEPHQEVAAMQEPPEHQHQQLPSPELPSPQLQQLRSDRWHVFQQQQQQQQQLPQEPPPPSLQHSALQQQHLQHQLPQQVQQQAVVQEEAPWEPSSPERLQQLQGQSQLPAQWDGAQVWPVTEPAGAAQAAVPGGTQAEAGSEGGRGPSSAEQQLPLSPKGPAEARRGDGSARGELPLSKSSKSRGYSSHRSRKQERGWEERRGRTRSRSRSRDQRPGWRGTGSPTPRKDKARRHSRSKEWTRKHSRSRSRNASPHRHKHKQSKNSKQGKGEVRRRGSHSRSRSPKKRRDRSPEGRRAQWREREGGGRGGSRSPRRQRGSKSPSGQNHRSSKQPRGRSRFPPAAKPGGADGRPPPQLPPWETLPSRNPTPPSDAVEQQGGLLLADGSAVLLPVMADGMGPPPQSKDFFGIPDGMPPELVGSLSTRVLQGADSTREEAARLLKAFMGRPSRSEPLGLWDATTAVFSYAARLAEELLDLFLKGQLSEDAHVQQAQRAQQGTQLSFASLPEFLGHLSRHLSLPTQPATAATGCGLRPTTYLPVDPRRRKPQQQVEPAAGSMPPAAAAPVALPLRVAGGAGQQQQEQPPVASQAVPWANGSLPGAELGPALPPLPSVVPFQSAIGPSVHGNAGNTVPAAPARAPLLNQHQNLRQLSMSLQHQASGVPQQQEAPRPPSQPLQQPPLPPPALPEHQQQPPLQPAQGPLAPGEFWRGMLRWQPMEQQGMAASPRSPVPMVAFNAHPVAGGSGDYPALARELTVRSERPAEEVVGMLQALKCRKGEQVFWFLLGPDRGNGDSGGGSPAALLAAEAQGHSAFCEVDMLGQPLGESKDGWDRFKGWMLVVMSPADAICSFLNMGPADRAVAAGSLVALALPCWWGWLFATDPVTGKETLLPICARGPIFLHQLPREIKCRTVRREALQVLPKLESNSFLCKAHKGKEFKPTFQALCRQLLQEDSVLVFCVPLPSAGGAGGAGAAGEGTYSLELVLWPTEESETKFFMHAGLMSVSGTKRAPRKPWTYRVM